MGILYALLTAALWALYNLVVRRGRESMDPGAGYLLTILINVVTNLSFLLLPLPGAGAEGFGWVPLLLFGVAGLSVTLLGRWLYFETVFTLGPSRASSWKNMAPVYTLILAAIFLGEPVTLTAVAGIAAMLAGAWALAREQERSAALGGGMKSAPTMAASAAKGQRFGILLGIGSGLAFSTGILARRAGLLIWPDAAWGAAIGAMIALVGWTPFAIARGEFTALLRSRMRGAGPWVLAGLLSSLAQLFTFLALRVLPSTITQVLTSLEPVFTMGFSLLLFGAQENLNRRLLAAVGVVCLGVALVVL
ncbi:MAG: EamA family transporter [Bacillota bacterium]